MIKVLLNTIPINFFSNIVINTTLTYHFRSEVETGSLSYVNVKAEYALSLFYFNFGSCLMKNGLNRTYVFFCEDFEIGGTDFGKGMTSGTPSMLSEVSQECLVC